MRRRAFLAAGILLAGAVGLGVGLRSYAGGRTVTVYAAASLTDAFNALGPEFERAQKGVKVRFNYGASSTLRTQIQQGAPADVFAAADYAQMTPLAQSGRVAAPQTFVRNGLVVVVPAANPGKIRSVKDLARPGLRLVTTAETVPIGRYTQEALKKLSGIKGFPADFAARVNASVVSRETNVRAVLARVELGEADAAIVYETDARSSPRVKSLPIPAAGNVVAEYPIAVLADSPHQPEAAGFVRFVLSGPGREILKRYGFR